MTSLKTVLLGSAAGIVAVGAAQAADLPVKKAAAAVQYVETCPVYGASFYKMPGTDICVKHFGSAKFQFSFQNARSFYDLEDKQKVDKAVANTAGWEWSIRPGWDFRSPTEYGTLRTVVQLRADQRNGVNESRNPTLTGSSLRNALFHRAYIEWAGFLIGRAGSQFVYWDQDDVITAIGGSPKATPAMQFTYVWNFGGGLKATLGAEDSTVWLAHNGLKDLTGGGVGAGTCNGAGANCNGAFTDATGGGLLLGPQRWQYDVIGSLSTEQAWGNAKLSAAAHHISVNSAGNQHFIDSFAANGGVDTMSSWPTNLKADMWGYGLLAGITFNLPMLGAKDQLLLEGTWCNGATAYCGVNGGAENNMTSFERSGNYLDGITRDDEDGYIISKGGTKFSIEKNKVWAVSAQLRHYWSPLWRTNIMGSYRKVNVADIVCKNADQSSGPVVGTGGADHGQCDGKAWDAGINLIWGQSRKTAEIGVEVAYKKVTQDLTPGNPGNDSDDVGGRNLSNGNRNPSGWTASAFIQRAW